MATLSTQATSVRNRSWRMKIPMLSIAVAIILPVVATPSPAAAFLNGYAYGGVIGNSATNIFGIDGYIRPSTSVAVNSPLHRAEWVNLCHLACAQWVQLGTYQGALPNSSSPNASHIFVENNWDGCFYSQYDKGILASPNQAYFISYDGTNLPSGCGVGREYEFALRKISVTSAPIAYETMNSPDGQALSKTELYSNGPDVPQGTDYFGTNDAHAASSGYGLHVQTTSGGTWGLWSTSQVAGTQSFAPPTLTVLQTYWSFKTTP